MDIREDGASPREQVARTNQGQRLVSSYTSVLFGLAGFLPILAAAHHSAYALGDDAGVNRVFLFAAASQVIAAGMCLVAGVVRAYQSRFSLLMTNVASSLLALVFPYGTGVSLYWLLTVRRIEVRGDDGDSAARTARQTKPPLARFSWLLLVSSAISFALAWVYSALIPSDDPGLLVTKRYAEAVHAYVALFGLAAALLRTTRSPAAIPASDAISAMSLLVFPLGPVLTIYWFCWVRRSEVAS